MSESRGTILWRVHTADGHAKPAAFDALVLAADRSSHDALGPSRLIGVDVPFERELPRVPVTLVIRASDQSAPLLCECDVMGPDGKRKVYGRSGSPLAVFVCSEDGIVVTGLPSPLTGQGDDA
jgi:hypothetical protein